MEFRSLSLSKGRLHHQPKQKKWQVGHLLGAFRGSAYAPFLRCASEWLRHPSNPCRYLVCKNTRIPKEELPFFSRKPIYKIFCRAAGVFRGETPKTCRGRVGSKGRETPRFVVGRFFNIKKSGPAP